jgi:PIN domain nuclease of toxin-antitoxin system
MISSPISEVWLSAATAWEIAIKASLNRVKLALPPAELIPDAIARYGLRPLPVTVEHALCAGVLPVHHKDPFDRMLIAQARTEGLKIVTVDRFFAAYSVEIVDASR